MPTNDDSGPYSEEEHALYKYRTEAIFNASMEVIGTLPVKYQLDGLLSTYLNVKFHAYGLCPHKHQSFFHHGIRELVNFIEEEIETYKLEQN